MRSEMCALYMPRNDGATRNFGFQKVSPIGTQQQQVDVVEGYHQYVYYFDLKKL